MAHRHLIYVSSVHIYTVTILIVNQGASRWTAVRGPVFLHRTVTTRAAALMDLLVPIVTFMMVSNLRDHIFIDAQITSLMHLKNMSYAKNIFYFEIRL